MNDSQSHTNTTQQNPLVSVIVPTRNSHGTLDACLASIVNQSYRPIELIVVDRDSSDGTKLIAKYYTNHVYNFGPERSAQRNFGAARATGKYVVIIDSDMELTRDVIRDCVDIAQYKPRTTGIIIPEQSFGKGFWAQCKRLERSYYIGNNAIEAARFFPRQVYLDLGGYDENMVSGEDWDLSARARDAGKLERVHSLIHHNEGELKLGTSLRKKFYYAKKARAYMRKHAANAPLTGDAGPLKRYAMFLSRPNRLLRNPVVGGGMLLMKTFEFGFGALGYLASGFSKKERA